MTSDQTYDIVSGFVSKTKMTRRFNIQSKMVLPYTLLFAAVIVAISLITTGIVYRRIDERIERQMERATDAISNMGFLLSDEFLSNVKISEVIGADIIIYNPRGEVIATTIPRDVLRKMMPSIDSADVEEAFSRQGAISLIKNIRYLDHPYKVTYRRLKTLVREDSTILSLMVSTEDIALAKRRSAITIGLVALSGILLIAVAGSLITVSITAPVKQLVKITQRVAAGDLTAEAEEKTRDEIGMLASSFNQMTRELKASRDKLVQAEKLAAVGQLAAGIAHEIRNPLTSMKMVVQLLKKRTQDDIAAQESLLVVLDEIIRLEIVINGLLDFARPMELTLRPANVMDIINDVLRLMEADLRHRKIELVKFIGEPLPEIMLDPDRMRQVFMNVILNSMQAMPEGGKLSVLCRYDRENSAVQIDISDTGVGMSQEVLKHVFDPFFSARTGGTGLGLANVKKIIEQHGGSVQIESAEGQGTKISVNLRAILRKELR